MLIFLICFYWCIKVYWVYLLNFICAAYFYNHIGVILYLWCYSTSPSSSITVFESWFHDTCPVSQPSQLSVLLIKFQDAFPLGIVCFLSLFPYFPHLSKIIWLFFNFWNTSINMKLYNSIQFAANCTIIFYSLLVFCVST